MTQMITVEPKMMGNIARSVNPLGCQAMVAADIEYVKAQGTFEGPKKALILGASSSYGLATRIVAAFGAGADTIGVSFERGPKDPSNLGTAGWYNNIYFREQAEAAGLVAKNFIGDAFSTEMKQQVIDYIKNEFGGQVDLVIYSLASPKRVDPATGQAWSSTLKPIGRAVTGRNINLETESLVETTVEAATPEEIEGTIKVMGGEDWALWIDALLAEGALAEGAKTVLYSYIGPSMMDDFYRGGTLGKAKEQAEATALELDKLLKDKLNGQAVVCVSKAVTTKASAVIPTLPLYCCALYRVMQEKGTHETPIMHKDRVLRTMLYGDAPEYDAQGRLRPDSWELDPATQARVSELVAQITPENITSDLTGYDIFRKEFLALNGFLEGVPDTFDYDQIAALQP
ncbi:MAG: enoyl-ACP reductase FabV [Candidatus Nanopelagicales bacterium]